MSVCNSATFSKLSSKCLNGEVKNIDIFNKELDSFLKEHSLERYFACYRKKNTIYVISDGGNLKLVDGEPKQADGSFKQFEKFYNHMFENLIPNISPSSKQNINEFIADVVLMNMNPTNSFIKIEEQLKEDDVEDETIELISIELTNNFNKLYGYFYGNYIICENFS